MNSLLASLIQGSIFSSEENTHDHTFNNKQIPIIPQVCNKIISKKNKNSHEEISEKVSTKKYSKISIKKRKLLIQKVMFQKYTIKEAAEEVGIKCSSAKAILKVYKNEGRIGKKQFRQKKNKNAEEPLPEKKTQKLYHQKEIVVNTNTNFEQNLPIFNQIFGNLQAVQGQCGAKDINEANAENYLQNTEKMIEKNEQQTISSPSQLNILQQLLIQQAQRNTNTPSYTAQISHQYVKEFYENILMRHMITNFLSQIEGSTNINQTLLQSLINSYNKNQQQN